MAIQAFIDDSGTKGQGALLVFGGLMGDAETWVALTDEWKATLVSEGLNWYKMDDALKRYKRFPEDEDERMRRFVGLIVKYPLRPFYVAVDWKGFDDVKGSLTRRPYRDLYFWPFTDSIFTVCHEMLLAGETEQSDIIFDEHNIFAPRMIEAWPGVRLTFDQSYQHLLPNMPRFENDKKVLPLQAADLIAGLVRGTGKDGSSFPFSWIWDSLAGRWSEHSNFILAERWQKMRASAKEIRARIVNADFRPSVFDLEFSGQSALASSTEDQVHVPSPNGERFTQMPIENNRMKACVINHDLAQGLPSGHVLRALYFNCDLVHTGRSADEE